MIKISDAIEFLTRINLNAGDLELRLAVHEYGDREIKDIKDLFTINVSHREPDKEYILVKRG